MKTLRNKLKHAEPYRVRDELMPLLFFRDDLDRWVFEYSFVTRLNDIKIGLRLNCDQSTVYRKSIEIIKNNKTAITNFFTK
jgi:hypothetical protein